MEMEDGVEDGVDMTVSTEAEMEDSVAALVAASVAVLVSEILSLTSSTVLVSDSAVKDTVEMEVTAMAGVGDPTTKNRRFVDAYFFQLKHRPKFSNDFPFCICTKGKEH